jgi:FecR protein
MKRSIRFQLLLLAALVCCLFAISAIAESNARIVRLSDVQGAVQIDRGTGQGFEKAFLNMPITEGVKLKTGDDGRAEIEFEDNSVIHLVPESTLQFTDLSLRDSGAKVSTIDLLSGEAYVNFAGKKDDEFTVTFGHEKTTLTRAAHLRVKKDENSAEVAVLNGDVPVSGPSGEVKVSKKQTAVFDLTNNDQYTVAKKVEQDPYDAWDKHEGEYHKRYEASNSYGSPYSYGFNDLNYYGNYRNVPGYGLCWQPYFTGMGWNPYMDGAWMLYPGRGYSWVSAYPWGWTPYHYGSWAFVPSYGWMWQPGNNWVAWNRLPPVINAPRNYVPPRPPTMNQPAMVAVGRGPTTSSIMPGAGPGSKLVLNRPTAGIGVPRGINNLNRVNRDFESRGQARVGVPGGSRGAAITAMPTGRGGVRTMGAPSGQAGRASAPSGQAGRTSAPSMGSGRATGMSPGRTSSSSGHSSGATPHK